MCGICGIYRKDKTYVDNKTIVSMCNVIKHRGPDDDGAYIAGHIGIGIRRLKVIDLETGHQPIHNEDKTIWVVLNGEIYNYQELRTKLEQEGHRFYTKSDTEVIVHLYEEYGEDFVKFLNGMFGFALWDSNRERIVLVRDRLGIKQLYYYEDNNMFAFGSEIKSILTIPEVRKNINYEALSDYFSLQYIPAPHTIYRDICKLPQASYIQIDNGNLKIKKYWSLNYGNKYISGNEAIDSTIRELKKSVQLQMISDVPLGAYLSGGIDSSILVAMMSSISDRPVETFSILWDQKSNAFDERKYSRFVANKYNTNHHEFLVKPQIEEVAFETIKAFDEPFANDSVIPNYHIARETKNHVTVALSGLGGDEVAAGYERYLGLKILRYFNLIPKGLRSVFFKRIINQLPDSKSGSPWIDRMKRFGMLSELSFTDSYYSIMSKMNESEKSELFTPETNVKINSTHNTSNYFYAYDQECSDTDDLNRLLYIDINTYMVDELLVLSDRMSMAHSLELRVPFLDHNLVEHFARIKPSMKLHGLTKKYLLKKIAENYFPRSFVYRKKMGFSTPLVLWLRGSLKGYMMSTLNKKSIEKTGILNPDTVEKYILEHVNRKRNHDTRLWALMMFMHWYNEYIDKVY